MFEEPSLQIFDKGQDCEKQSKCSPRQYFTTLKASLYSLPRAWPCPTQQNSSKENNASREHRLKHTERSQVGDSLSSCPIWESWPNQEVNVLQGQGLPRNHRVQLWGAKRSKMAGEVQARVATKILPRRLGEGRWYWIHDFVATFGVNDRPIYMALCS